MSETQSADESSTETQVVHRSEEFDDDEVEYIGRGYDGESLADFGFDVHIGDPGWLGNPYRLYYHDGNYSREESMEEYEEDLVDELERNNAFRHAVKSLQGKRLACFCRSSDEDEPRCHGDVIKKHIKRLNNDSE